jgi:hypothetical protein
MRTQAMVLMGEHASQNLPWHLVLVLRMKLRINILNSVADPDPGSGPFLPPRIQDQGSWMIFSRSRISDPYHIPNSIYLQDFTYEYGEKQEKLNFV